MIKRAGEAQVIPSPKMFARFGLMLIYNVVGITLYHTSTA